MEGLSEIQELGAKVLRPEKRITDEDLVASELAAAVLSEPLGKIRHTVEAMYLLDEGERRQAGIAKEEEEEAGRIYALALALQNARSKTFPDLEMEGVRILWPFPQEEAGTQLAWVGEKMPLYFIMEKEARDDLSALPLPERVYLATGRHWVAREVHQALVVRFVRYAMPIAARLMRKIMRMISPGSYRQALQLLGGRRRGKAGE